MNRGDTAIDQEVTTASEFEHDACRESLAILHRQTPNAIAGHLVAAALVVYALAPVVSLGRLIAWWLVLAAVSGVRFIAAWQFNRRWPIDDASLPAWSRWLLFLTFLQTLMWGMASVLAWPDSTEYRAVLTAILAGVIAAGGVILAIHRRSFHIYCLPIAIPVTIQLLLTGGRLEWIMAILVVLYSGLLMVAVDRLASAFFEGLVVRMKMQALSRTDPLTQLANRRGFDEYLSDMWQNSVRSSQSLGLILADVDYFKNYNDQYGHPQGDEALRRMGEIMNGVASRGTDLCARIGGEEFAIIMPSTDFGGVLKVADEIRAAFHEARMDHGGSPYDIVTVSMGVANVVPGKNDSIDDFFNATDQALYRAKKAGRDRIERARLGD